MMLSTAVKECRILLWLDTDLKQHQQRKDILDVDYLANTSL
jgi:hypothetical protein